MMIATRRCGWYYRVLEEGLVKAGGEYSLEARPCPEWPVDRVIGLHLGGDGKRDSAAVKAVAQLDVLATNWRARAQNMCDV